MIVQMILTNLILFLCACGGIVYGIVKLARKEMPITYISVFCAWVCLALGRLYMLLVLLIDRMDPNEFNLSWIAYIASFVFLFSTNYCHSERETEQLAKGGGRQRLIALAAPLCVLALFAGNTLLYHRMGINLNPVYRVFCAVLSLLIAQTTYFNLRYILAAKDSGSVLYKLKPFHFVMLGYSLLTMIEVTMRELMAVLWEDGPDNASRQSNLRNLISETKKALREVGADGIIRKGWNTISIDCDMVDCDYYDFLRHIPDAVNRYHGEYMMQYSWAEFTTAELSDD